MRIVHIITGLNDGGAEGVLYRLCSHDKANKHCIVSLMDLGKYGSLLQSDGHVVHTLGLKRGRIHLCVVARLMAILRGAAPDVVQTWMYHADLLGGLTARMVGCESVVWNIRNGSLEQPSRFMTRLVVRILAALSRWMPTRIVVCATDAAEVHIRKGYARSKMQVIPNGYDLSLFQPDAALRSNFRRLVDVDESIVAVGAVGRFDPQKDHASLIAAMRILAERGIRFVGVFVGRDMLESNAAINRLLQGHPLKNNLRLLGPRTDIPTVMNGLDIHVLASAYGEAFPNVLAEAMACGTPCVTTEVGDSADIVGNTGWVVPKRNPLALANAIADAISESSSPRWNRRRIAARQRVEKLYGIQRMVAAYNELWQQASAADSRGI